MLNSEILIYRRRICVNLKLKIGPFQHNLRITGHNLMEDILFVIPLFSLCYDAIYFRDGDFGINNF